MTNQIELEYIACEELHQPLPTIKTCFFCWSTNSEEKKNFKLIKTILVETF